MLISPDLLSRAIDPPKLFEPIIPECVIRSTPEDFQVDEIPAYAPSGKGEHAYLWIEKRGLTSPELIHRIIKNLGVPGKDVGLAGQKDRHAVTRQFVSIPKRFAEHAAKLNDENITVLFVTAHSNKLKTGHLRGNKFRLILRGTNSGFTAADVQAVHERLQMLAVEGFANYFGSQRFGHDGNTLIDGLSLLKDTLPSDHWPENKTRTMRRLVLSAVQSAIFNLVVGRRVTEGTLRTPLPGEVVVRRSGTKPYVFPAEGPTEGIVPAGPLPGPEMLAATGAVAEVEREIMSSLRLSPKDFQKYSRLTSGIRRKMVEFPVDAEATLTEDGAIAATFSLASGTYATVVLREIVGSLKDSGSLVESTVAASSDSDGDDE
ncbi:MAG TPA: tRNA pseudouridine(13) synthase TruD [Planctomycetaceae bacterium]|nr:tRNA pseudouridine(13) synthase TruD [Planctomycetaceae bacterium]